MFESNVPGSFLAHEVSEFVSYLERMPGPYLVCADESGLVLACGGIATREGNVTLCWGIVGREHQRRGVGQLLLRARLVLAIAIPEARRISLNTSQHTAGFFAREGFRTNRVRIDYFAPGLDRHDMELTLDELSRDRIAGYALAGGTTDGAVRTDC